MKRMRELPVTCLLPACLGHGRQVTGSFPLSLRDYAKYNKMVAYNFYFYYIKKVIKNSTC